MNANRCARVVVSAVAAVLMTLVSWPINTVPASAAACPDVEVTFARPTSEAPGVGEVGQEFIDALRSQIGGRSPKAIDLCAPGDPVCSPGAMFTVATREEMASPEHLSYAHSAMPAQAATFVANQL